MVRNWSRPASITELSLGVNNITDGQSINLSGGFLGFKYFESLLSPHITAKLLVIDTGYSVTAGAGERSLNLFSLAEEIVGNKLNITLENGSGNIYNADSSFDDLEPEEYAQLKFDANYPLEVTSVSDVMTKDKKQILSINLCSEPGARDATIRVDKKYDGKISETARTVLIDTIENGGLIVPAEKAPDNAVHFTPTKFPSAEYGNGRSPFEFLLDLCPKAVPVLPTNAAPGFFIFETQDGFYFRGIDSLISSTPYPIRYVYRDVATFCEQSNFRILKYEVRKPSGNLYSQQGAGINAKFISFNPYSNQYDETFINANEKVLTVMGSEEFNNIYEDENKGQFSVTDLQIVNPGNFSVGIGSTVNNDPLQWYAAGRMRYNLIFSRMIDMVVPCNLELRAGMIINCEFPALTDTPQEGVSDEKVSGKYLIVNLAHEFTSDGQTGSLTHLTIVRDTDGVYTVEED
jgi:hypothetical protein